MIKISKAEAKYLNSKGVKFGAGLNKTRSRHPHYYLTSDPRYVKLLKDYRIEHIESCHDGNVI